MPLEENSVCKRCGASFIITELLFNRRSSASGSRLLLDFDQDEVGESCHRAQMEMLQTFHRQWQEQDKTSQGR